jgi:hypothetical protein
MQPVLPTWFKQRQGKAETTGDNTYRLTAPILPEAYISIGQGENGRWAAFLRTAADGPAQASTEPVFETPGGAWAAAFELHRTHLVV